MRNKRKNIAERGITLIALVVTIIVLLILAGVTLNIAIDNGGLISRAKEASKEKKIGDEKEALELAYSSTKIASLGELVLSIDLQNELLNNGYNTNVTGTDVLTVTFLDSHNSYIINQLDNNSKFEAYKPVHRKLNRLVNETDYGKSVNYSVTINGETLNNWRIFYNDGENVYIIYGDYLKASLMPYDNRVTTNPSTYEYSVWSSKDSVNNMLQYISTASIWNEFAAGYSGATAYGAPSARQLSLSYGVDLKKNPGFPNGEVNGDLYVNTDLNVGYWVNTFDTSHNSTYLYRIYKDGRLLSSDDGGRSKDYSLRPIVCIPSNATGTKLNSISIDSTPVEVEEEATTTPTSSTIDYGNKTAATVTTGDTITVGNYNTRLEKFLVLSNDGTKITALPYYNITLDEENPIQNVFTERTKFCNEEITNVSNDLVPEKIYIQKYVTAYKNSLEKIGGFNINTRIPTRDELLSLTDEQRNPRSSGKYYLCSATYVSGKQNVYYVNEIGSINYTTSYTIVNSSYNAGVRPLIEINI